MTADSSHIASVMVFEANELLTPAGVKEQVDLVLALDGKVLSTQEVVVRVMPPSNGGAEQTKLTGDLRVPPPM